MTDTLPGAGRTPVSIFANSAQALFNAAHLLLPHIEAGRAIDSLLLRSAMEDAFDGTDAAGVWDWKSAYDACEGAQVLFLRNYGSAIFRKATSPRARLAMLARIAALSPTHTRRSEIGQALQQFSTPLGLAFVAACAAAIRPGELVLEPSAGTGLLAAQAETMGARLVLNELAEIRAGFLGWLFTDFAVTRHDAAHIDDHLAPAVAPDVVLMNPPFSAVAHVDKRMKDAALRHIGSALGRLRLGGRLVAITAAGCAPDAPAWAEAFAQLQERGRIVFSAAIDGRIYARHGTTMDTRLTVIDRVPAEDGSVFPASPGMAPDLATLLGWVLDHVPPPRGHPADDAQQRRRVANPNAAPDIGHRVRSGPCARLAADAACRA